MQNIGLNFLLNSNILNIIIGNFNVNHLICCSNNSSISDLVSDLLCCSVPPYHNHEWRGGDMVTQGQADNTRTMEWVMASQKMRDTCRLGQCGQDCGDGFCCNVWNNLVHV